MSSQKRPMTNPFSSLAPKVKTKQRSVGEFGPHSVVLKLRLIAQDELLRYLQIAAEMIFATAHVGAGVGAVEPSPGPARQSNLAF